MDTKLITLLCGWTSRTKGGIILTASCLLMFPCKYQRMNIAWLICNIISVDEH